MKGTAASSAAIDAFAARFFAGCDPGRLSAGIGSDDILRVAEDFVLRRYRDALCAFLYGSSLSGELQEFSDIDIAVVLPAVAPIEVRRSAWNGFPVEVQLLGRPNILSAFRTAKRTGRANIVFSLAEGKLLYQQGNFGFQLQDLARQVVQDGPDRIDFPAARTAYRTVASSILDLAGNACADERFATIMAIQPILMDIYFAARGNWAPTRKWAVRSAPDFAARLNSELDRAHRTGNVDGLIALTQALFAPWGNLTWDEPATGQARAVAQ